MLMQILRKLWHDDKGQGMVEYGLILALIAIAVIVVLTTFGDELTSIFSKAKDTAETVDSPM